MKIENQVKSKNTYFLNILEPIDALKKKDQNNISIKRIKSQDCFGVEITSKDYIEIFLFSNMNKISYQDIQSESKWVSIVKDRKGKLVKTTSYDGVELST